MTLADSTTWLREFYRRFDVETKLLYDREPFWRVCQKCPDGYCCSRSSYVAANKTGNPFLVEDWWLMLEFVQEHFSVADKNGWRATFLRIARTVSFFSATVAASTPTPSRFTPTQTYSFLARWHSSHVLP